MCQELYISDQEFCQRPALKKDLQFLFKTDPSLNLYHQDTSAIGYCPELLLSDLELQGNLLFHPCLGLGRRRSHSPRKTKINLYSNSECLYVFTRNGSHFSGQTASNSPESLHVRPNSVTRDPSVITAA